MSRVAKSEQTDAINRLREWVKPGDTIHCVLRNVSRSGMQRTIQLVKLQPDGGLIYLGWNAAAALGLPYDRSREGIKIGGCGMDMGFHLVYNLARVLFADGFTCTGEKCPSNDHSNGDRDYMPHAHSDSGYALNHRWI